MTSPSARDPGDPLDTLIPVDGPLAELHMDQAHSARMYDYFLGGKTNYRPDREAAERVLDAVPSARTTARQNRAFLHRAVGFLAEAGIDQFLDVGTGIPTSPNLHEIAQRINPAARVAYVDNDPIVLTYSRALLVGSPQGRTTYLEADLRQPATILSSPELAETLDLDRPVALSLVAVLHFYPDDAKPAELVKTLAGRLVSGSYLVISHGASDLAPDVAERGTDAYRASGIPLRLRTRGEVEALLPSGLEIIEPGTVPLHHWRPDYDTERVRDSDVSGYALIAYKP